MLQGKCPHNFWVHWKLCKTKMIDKLILIVSYSEIVYLTLIGFSLVVKNSSTWVGVKSVGGCILNLSFNFNKNEMVSINVG